MIDQAAQKKRPGWVWAISIFFFVSAAWTLLTFYLIYTGAVSLSVVEEAYFESLTAIDYTLTILIALINISGAIALLMLRRAAFYLFVTAFGANLLSTAWHMMTKGWVDAISGAGFTGAIIGWVLLAAVCVYSWRLVQRGVLT